MTSNEKRMILINSIYEFSSGLASVFLNVYLYTYTESIASMAIFTFFRSLMIPIFFVYGGKLANRKSYPFTMMCGLIFMASEMAFVLAIKDGFGLYPILVYVPAIIYGIGEAFFWLSINSLNQLVTTPDSTAKYLSNIGIGNNIAKIVAPLLASLILVYSKTDLSGYRFIFAFVLVIYIFLIYVASTIKCKSEEEKYDVWACIIDKSPVWRTYMISDLLLGVMESLSLVINGLLVYDAIGGSGSIYSLLLAVFAMVSILAFSVYRKYASRNRILPMYIGSAFMIGTTTLALVHFPNLFGGLYYGIGNAILNVPHTNGSVGLMMNEIDRLRIENNENITGRVIAKEFPLSIGRFIGMGLIVGCHTLLPSALFLKVSVTIISMFPIINALWILNAKRKGILK